MYRRLLCALLGMLASALLAEAVLRLCPVATGYDYLPLNAENPVLRGTPFKPYTFSEGWNFRLINHGRLNNDGFIADRDYGRRAAGTVLLIGDSFVQAAAVPRDRNLHAVLASRLQPVDVFGLYRSGGSLPDYLALARWGIERYQARAFVFNIVSGDVDDSVALKESGYYFAPSAAGYVQTRIDRVPHGTIGSLLNKSKLFRYVYDNLAFGMNFPARAPMQSLAVGGDQARRKKCQDIALYFLTELEQVTRPERVVFLINHIRREGSFTYDADIDVLRDLARERGFHVIDLGEDFTAYEARTGNRLDFSPVDTHWNVTAQQVVADELTPVLRGILGK